MHVWPPTPTDSFQKAQRVKLVVITNLPTHVTPLWSQIITAVGIIRHLSGPRFADYAGSSLSILTHTLAKSPNLGPKRCHMIPTPFITISNICLMYVLAFTQIIRGKRLPQKMMKRSNLYETDLHEKESDILNNILRAIRRRPVPQYQQNQSKLE